MNNSSNLEQLALKGLNIRISYCIVSICSCSDSPDFIVVRDGPDVSSPVIAQYCNTQRSEQVMSSGRQLYIDFIVDNQRQRNGFEASYEFVEDSVAVLGTAVDIALQTALHSPTVLQQAESNHGPAEDIVPSYHAGTRLFIYIYIYIYLFNSSVHINNKSIKTYDSSP